MNEAKHISLMGMLMMTAMIFSNHNQTKIDKRNLDSNIPNTQETIKRPTRQNQY